ncbi:MAG TPA: DUF4340 domain-containing protein [Deltaproteobacteria bacterium]|nr:DUF4340 domain-containing protein [Deltaproteobacteria bacterium]
MRRFRGSILALGVLLLVLGIAWWLDRSEAVPEVSPDTLFRFDKEDLVAFTIVRPDATIEIRRIDDRWTAVGRSWRPNRAMIRRVAHQLHDLDARANVIDDPEAPEVYGLGSDAIEVTLELRGGERLAFRVGDPNPTSVSYYVQVLSSDQAEIGRVYVVKKASMDYYRLDIQAFREDRIATFDAADAVSLVAQIDGGQIEAERTGPLTWQLHAPVEQEASRDKIRLMLGRISALRALAFEADAPGDLAPWGIGEDAPRIAITLGSGEVIAVRLGDMLPDTEPPQRYAYLEADDAVYVVKAGILESFRLSADELRNRVLLGKHAWDVVALQVTPPADEPLRLTKTSDDWRWPDGAVISGSTPERVAGRAAELKAIVFHEIAPGGFGPEFATVQLWFEDQLEATVRLGRRWEIEVPDAQEGIGGRTEGRQLARIDDRETIYEIDDGLAEVIEDLWREHGRKLERDADKRLDEVDPGN